jgi:hypothetical protein
VVRVVAVSSTGDSLQYFFRRLEGDQVFLGGRCLWNDDTSIAEADLDWWMSRPSDDKLVVAEIESRKRVEGTAMIRRGGSGDDRLSLHGGKRQEASYSRVVPESRELKVVRRPLPGTTCRFWFNYISRLDLGQLFVAYALMYATRTILLFQHQICPQDHEPPR